MATAKETSGITTAVLSLIVAIIIIGAVGSSLYFANLSSKPTVSKPGATSFGDSWGYIGNVTLSGNESSCEIMRLPCPMNPSNPAEEFKSNNGSVAVVETISVCGPQVCTNTTIVLINNALYCIVPKSDFDARVCPNRID